MAESLDEEAVAAAAAAAGDAEIGSETSVNAAVRNIPWDLEESTIFGLVDAFEQRRARGKQLYARSGICLGADAATTSPPPPPSVTMRVRERSSIAPGSSSVRLSRTQRNSLLRKKKSMMKGVK